LMSYDDDFEPFGRPYSMSLGSSYHMPMFGMGTAPETEHDKMRKEQQGESCQIAGYFDTNKVPGNFHFGTHGTSAPSYLSWNSKPMDSPQNMQHTIHHLAFTEVEDGGKLINATQPLDGFDSPKAFTFQYYIMVTPATVEAPGKAPLHGYQFTAGSFVTNELIGPAVFFRLDIDPIRVTYFTEEKRWSRFLVNLCAVVGGCIAVGSMLSGLVENAVAKE